MRNIDIFWSDCLVGYLRENENDELEFYYDKTWINKPDAIALSPDFPLHEDFQAGEKVLAYFDNLLPEGNVRDFIALAEHISPSNVFGLLERFGGDTAGALCLLPQGEKPSKENKYLSVSMKDIQQWFVTSRGLPLNLKDGGVRASLSGAQDKMSIYINSMGEMFLPLGNAPSSHIIKPSLSYATPIPQTAINEAMMMTLAKEVGLCVAETEYISDLDAVIVRRYDRKIMKDGSLKRLHQNDLCQTLGVSSKRKYESEGGASFAQCLSAVMKYSHNPEKDKSRLIEWLIFNLAIGNMDSHSKNISLFATENKIELAPFYDLVCTSAYPNLSQRFAFKIGGENRPGWLRARHWVHFSDEINMPIQDIHQIMVNLCARIADELPKITITLRHKCSQAEGLEMIETVQTEVRRGIGRLWAIAQEIECFAPGADTTRSPRTKPSV